MHNRAKNPDQEKFCERRGPCIYEWDQKYLMVEPLRSRIKVSKDVFVTYCARIHAPSSVSKYFYRANRCFLSDILSADPCNR